MTTYKSKIEHRLHTECFLRDWDYEIVKLKWIDKNGKSHTYTTDFVNRKRTKLIEAKGFFNSGDRTKYKLIKQQHSDIEFNFAFEDIDRKIKGTKTTYKDWCKKNGFGCFSFQQLLNTK